MNRFLLLLIVASLFVSCKSKKAVAAAKPEGRYKSIEITKADVRQKERAYEFGKRVLSACNSSRFKQFTASEATEQLRKNTTPDRLTKTCQKYRAKYGTFKDLRLVEVIEYKKSELILYRYKAAYQKNNTIKELRVIMDGDRVTSIQSRDWTDKFEP